MPLQNISLLIRAGTARSLPLNCSFITLSYSASIETQDFSSLFDSQSMIVRLFNHTIKLREVHKMPIYEYACGDCPEVFSVFQGISAAEKDTQCPKCGSINVKKQISSFSCCSVGGGASSPTPSGGFSGG